MTAQLTRPVLVLDSGYQAVNVVPLRRALALLAAGKAVAVEEDGTLLFRSERQSFPCPVIIRLFIAIAQRVYRSFRLKFNKRNVMLRDQHTCQYCGAQGVPLTVDHIFPRSRRSAAHPRGGPSSWENCTTACFDCNRRKGNRTPEEAGMRLMSRPTRPRWYLPLLQRWKLEGAETQWRSYLKASP